MPNTFTTDTTGTKVFDCPARNGGVAFALKTGDKWYGYVGLGYDGTNYLRDFWRFDPETNSWSKIANYPGDAVRYASCFVIDNVAYVGCGEDYDNNILGDFYKYDASTGEWSQVSGIGTPCAQAASFTSTATAMSVAAPTVALLTSSKSMTRPAILGLYAVASKTPLASLMTTNTSD